jgi:hypothetical protein
MVTAYWNGDQLVGVIPRVISEYRVVGFSVYHYVRPIGADPNLTEIRVPLIHSEFHAQVIASWLKTIESFQDSRGLHKVVVPVRITPALGDEVAESLAIDDTSSNWQNASQLELLHTRQISNFVLDVDGNWEDFRRGLKRNIKESLRRCYNSLARDGLSAALTVWAEPDEVLSKLPAFCAMHGERATQQGSVEHPDYFADEVNRQFLERLAKDAKSTRLHLFGLVVNGQVVAMRLGFVVNTELYMYYSGYRLDHGQYSVMTTLVNEMIHWAHDNKLKRVNFSIGNDVSKTRWGPKELVYAEQHYVRKSAVARFMGRLMLHLKHVRQGE